MQVADVPEELAAMAAGPELAAALDALAVSQVPNDRMLDVLGVQYRQLCHEQARMAAALTELSRCSPVPGPAQHADRHLADLDGRPGDRLPGAALRRHTEIRDRTCTFAGVCRRPAHASEQDHSHDHATGGATQRINLGPLCHQDHHVKHRAGWTVTQAQPGTFVWHSPLGGGYTTQGEVLLPELPEPAPTDPGPEPDLPSRVVEGPILRRPPPPPPAPRPAAPVEHPDEPPF